MKVSSYLRGEARAGRRVLLTVWAGGDTVRGETAPVVPDGYVYYNNWLAPMLNAVWRQRG